MASSKNKSFEFNGVVVTGLSGAGKSVTLRALEDMGYFCIDNLPLPLLPSLFSLYRKWGHKLNRVAVGVDIRTGLPALEFKHSLAHLKKEKLPFKILFLDCDNNTLLRRFSETRRRHPLSGSVANGIRRERRLLNDIKSVADKIIDTSRLTPTEVKEAVVETLGIRHPRGMAIVFTSFGYKHGLPLDADVVWDLRFMPNPNYIPRFKHKTGQNKAVARFVFENPVAKKFISSLKPLLLYLLERYASEGKSYLTVALGCTGGQHRSVAVAEKLAEIVRKESPYDVRVLHRDLPKLKGAR
jgi:UPF0042 nucleotide-binding protein